MGYGLVARWLGVDIYFIVLFVEAPAGQLCVCVCVCIYISLYIHIYIHVCVYTYMYVCMYINK